MPEFDEMLNCSRRGTLRHTRNLLGKYLVRADGDRIEAWMITEVEAYDGERDLACHARFGRTARSKMLYRRGGIWYVYLCYGAHEMLNLVVGPADWPAATLIRGVDGIVGPGRVTKALHIDRRLNGQPVARDTGLYVEDRGVCVPARLIKRTPRIGIDYAGEFWAGKLWRFTFDPRVLPRSSRSHHSR